MYLFYLEVNYFTFVLVLPYTSTCICHRYTRVPHPEPPSLLPSRTIPQRELSDQKSSASKQSQSFSSTLGKIKETGGNGGNSARLYFWAPKSLQMVTAAMKLKDTYSLEEKL